MSERTKPDYLLIFMICVSIFGLLAIYVLALQPPISQEDFPWRKPLIGSIFAMICIFGVIVAVLPKKCVEASDSHKRGAASLAGNKASTAIRGHHPDCRHFSAHVIRLGNACFCAACTGLLFGAIVSLVGTVLYFFFGWNFRQSGLLAILVGQVGILLGFSQYKLKSCVRLVANSVFVLAAFLILVEIDALTKNVLIDLYTVVFIIFWLLTRIAISKWNNKRICDRCETCEVKAV